MKIIYTDSFDDDVEGISQKRRMQIIYQSYILKYKLSYLNIYYDFFLVSFVDNISKVYFPITHDPNALRSEDPDSLHKEG